MTSVLRTMLALMCLLGAGEALAASPLPPIAAFARLPNVQGPRVSPDGRYVLYRTGVDGKQAVAVLDRRSGKSKAVLVNDSTERYSLSWCDWGNDTRLLCGLRAPVDDGIKFYSVTRLLAINADGSDLRVLVARSRAGDSQFQDRVLDWTPASPNTVLVQVDEDRSGYPSIYELDIYTGSLTRLARSHPPIRKFVSDGQGEVRLGSGYRGAELFYYARRFGETQWRRLARFEAFSRSNALLPLAVVPGTNRAYATGQHDGRTALWEIDLADQEGPKLVAWHPRVDIDSPFFASDGRLLGIAYEFQKPEVYYVDEKSRQVVETLSTTLPDALNRIVDVSRDESVYIVHARSDVESAYYDVDTSTEPWTVGCLGREYPELEPATLSHMQPMEYAATDGTRIPAYLTLPAGVPAKSLPVIVLPHGWPIARDSWDFDFLVQFLASRGYAVLQMNFRGSDGYGDAWFRAAHQDWGGLTYSDIRDGARWAAAQDFADPSRMCIVGWSFGGYAALLGTVRDPDLFRCSASIAGVSDLLELERNSGYFEEGRIVELQVGTDWDKLKADSPRRHAKDARTPVLLVHGTYDPVVGAVHSRLMAKALKSAEKPYELVEIEDGDHQLWRPHERQRLLEALEGFLARSLAQPP